MSAVVDRVYLLRPREHSHRSSYPGPSHSRAHRHASAPEAKDYPDLYLCSWYLCDGRRRRQDLLPPAGRGHGTHEPVRQPQRNLRSEFEFPLERLTIFDVVGSRGQRRHHLRLHSDSETPDHPNPSCHDHRPRRHSQQHPGQRPVGRRH